MSCEEILILILFHISIIPTFTSQLSNYEHYLPLKTNYASTNREIDHPKLPPRYLKVPTNIQTYEGSSVILSCSIENLGERMVFWIRNSDLQILTAGLLTFSSDSRFRVNHENAVDENDWSLLITDVKTQDSGIYECQINTDPKMKMNVNLLVKETEEMMEMDSPFHQVPGASIEGGSSQILKRGHTITLTCRVFGIMSDSSSRKAIEWMKNGESLNLKTRNEGTVTTIDTVWTESGDGISRLTLAMLRDDDEGNYACCSNGFISESVQLKVSSGNTEKGAPEEHNSGEKIHKVKHHLLTVQILIIISNILLCHY